MSDKKSLFEENIPSRFLNQINGKAPWENYKSEHERIGKLLDEEKANEEIEKALHEEIEEVLEELFKGWK